MIVDLFAGPGGWSEGLSLLGLSDVGIELDASACDTRGAAGHPTIRADVTTLEPKRFAGATGLIASPPCTDFSAAGGRAGRSGKTGHLVDVPLAWVEEIRPEWVACEQVPEVLPIWQEHAARYRELGYSTWTGILCAADYGVPQTRRRAILMASSVGPALPPEPTHAENPEPGLWGTLKPWVTMAQALGWIGENVDTPARTLCGGRGPRWLYPDPDGTHGRQVMVLDRRQQNPDGSPVPPVQPDRPAPSLTATAGAKSQWVWKRQFGEETIRLTLEEAAILQSFRADYPFQGTKSKRFEQVGNAIPCLMAAHIISALTDRALEQAA